eukprot:TRINITY_DN5234_c1_g1_i2.p1 TRINITY_DN5234_c1_g1~~TRINITY_DN5234_c1_g1_i2.p1  ORF type:complete len:439 (-),score=132.97 TRINITY_DN5234_c1_g1_i2:282-1598(-)
MLTGTQRIKPLILREDIDARMNTSLVISVALFAVFLSAFVRDLLPAPKPKAIGIDLGTTYSCVAIYVAENGTATILPDAEGNRCIPSVVSFAGGNVEVGFKAKAQLALTPATTVFDAKRFIGRSMDEITGDEEIDLYGFTVKPSTTGTPLIETEDEMGMKKTYTPEEISSLVLRRLKETAEAHLGQEVHQAVIAVPVEFNERQKEATRKAAKLAGLKVMRLIYEPTAASMAYGIHDKRVDNIVVYDFGGGTLDVSVMGKENRVFKVMGKSGDKHLGGEDFNHHMMEYISRNFLEKHKLDVNADRFLLQQLRREVENGKIELSQKESTTVTIQLEDGRRISDEISRTQFETLNADLFQRTMKPVTRALEISGVDKTEIDEVVLVGGSTRIPKVRELLKEYFGKEPNFSINPDEAVAYGTAIQAGILTDAANIQIATYET